MLKIGQNWGNIANYPPPNAQQRSAPCSEPFEKIKFLRFRSQLKKYLPLLQVKSKTRLKSCNLGLNVVIWPRFGEARYFAMSNIFSIK